VVGVGAEPSEFVGVGQMVVRLARRDGRDAVFDVPSTMLDTISGDARFRVSLVTDPATSAWGRVREVAPQADPVTRTFRIRVGLTDPPPLFRLGSAVQGTLENDTPGLLQIPTSALIAAAVPPAVWVVDPVALKVSSRKVEIGRTEPTTTWIANGLQTGDIVVTAGTNALSEGQSVRIPGGES
jgi:RND family efflux transporter MFP subunit